MDDAITNTITILIGITGILGTLLAIISALFKDQLGTAKVELSNILIQLTNNFSSYNSNSFNYEIRFLKVKNDTENYQYAFESMKALIEKQKQTLKYCIRIGRLVLVFLCLALSIVVYESLVGNNILLIISVIVIIIILLRIFAWNKLLLPIIMFLIPNIQRPESPTYKELLSPAFKICVPQISNITASLPLNLLAVGSIIKTYNINDDDFSFITEFNMQIDADNNKYKAIAILTFAQPYYFSGKFMVHFEESEPISYEIADSALDIKYKNSIFFGLTEPKEKINFFRLSLLKDDKITPGPNVVYFKIPETNIFTPRGYSEPNSAEFVSLNKIELKEPKKEK